jgi:hypothetical protein
MRSKLLAVMYEADVLFQRGDVVSWLKEVRQACKREIESLEESNILNTDPNELAAYFASKYGIEPIRLDVDGMNADDQGEIQVDVSWDRNRFVIDRGQPALVPGRRVVMHVPFGGREQLLHLRGSQAYMTSLRAKITLGELLLTFEYPADRRPNIRAETDAFIEKVKQMCAWQQDALSGHNDGLKAFTSEAIAARRKRILEDRQHLDSLGIPIRRRGDAPKTYAAPGITRAAGPATSQMPTAPPEPMEPTLVHDLYEHIIQVTSSMAKAMERTPGNYAGWGEEQLRDALLVMLNTHYEGQATGETFNKSGKTDILIRVDDRNVFVDECKWWSGSGAFAGVDGGEPSTLDQLLGYTTWRDAKLAMTIFVKNKDMGRVLKSARESLEAHPAFVGWTESEEGQLRCRVRLPGQDERGADLAVIFVHLPSG